ncbi:MAG: hypothetical protein HY314_02615 [Acidobacteria bacterium]|nr:hypothetical protein [Acidobacteriota bacterium]
MTEQGLLTPKEELQWDEVVVEEKSYQPIIRPKSMTQLTYGILKGDLKWLEQIIENVETGGAAIDETKLLDSKLAEGNRHAEDK